MLTAPRYNVGHLKHLGVCYKGAPFCSGAAKTPLAGMKLEYLGVAYKGAPFLGLAYPLKRSMVVG